MYETLIFALMTFSAVFFVVDPPAAVPVFLAMTAGDTPHKRRSMALRAALASTIMLIVFAFTGGLLFKLFGITLGAFKVAGGILLLLMSIDMLRAEPTRARTSPEETQEGIEKDDVALIPMAMPMLAGPGSLSTVMVLMGQTEGDWVKRACVVGAVLLTGLLSWLFLRGASFALRVMGRTGLNVLSRVMGLILSAIAIQFILNGLHDAYVLFFPAGR